MTNGDGTFRMNKRELRSKTVFQNERKFKRNEYTLLFSQFELNGTLWITSFQHEKAAREKYRSADWKLRLYRHFKNKIISKVYILYWRYRNFCLHQSIHFKLRKISELQLFRFQLILFIYLYMCKCCYKKKIRVFIFALRISSQFSQNLQKILKYEQEYCWHKLRGP